MATEVDRLELVLEANLARVTQQLTALETRLYGIKGAMKSAGAAGKVPIIPNAATAVSNRNSKSLLASLSKLTLAFFALRRVGRFVMDSIKSSMDFAETVNLFQTVFRKLGLDAGKEFEMAFIDRAQEFNERMSSAFTLDPKILMDYQGRFAQMANSMGLVSETAYEMSEGFTALGLDIASLFNINISDAMLKLQSGLAGQIRPLRTLGVDISKTSLAAAALSYGITESFEKMDAATKVQLRYLEVMRQLEIVYGDMARTIESPANQARILAANFDLLKRSIGNSLIPMITWLMPYLNGMAIALTSIAQQIAVFFGWEMPDWKQTPIFMSDDIDFADEMSDSVDGVTESVKKYKNSILGIDQLNLMAKQDTGTGGSGGGYGKSGGYAVLDKAIADRTKAYMDEMNKQIDAMTNKGKEFGAAIEGKMKAVLITVGLIGGAILAWKFATGFATGLNSLLALFGGGAAGLGATATGTSAFAVISKGVSFLSSNLGKVASVIGAILGAWTLIQMGVTVVKDQTSLATKEMDIFAYKSENTGMTFQLGNEAMRKRVKAFTDQIRSLSDEVYNLRITDKIVTEKDVDTIRNRTESITKTLINELSSDKNNALKKLEPLKKALGKEAYDKLVQDTEDYYEKQILKITKQEEEINRIMADAAETGKKLTVEQHDLIDSYREQMQKKGVESLSDSAYQSKIILENLKNNAVAISIEQASEIIQKAIETRDGTIKAANEQYQGVILEAAKLYGVGTPEYEEIERVARNTRDNTIYYANQQFDGIKNAAEIKLGELSVYIDTETGQMLTKQQVFSRKWKAAFEDMFSVKIPDAFKKIVEWLAGLSGKSITIDAKSSVTGTSLDEQLKTKYMFGSTLVPLPTSATGAIFNSGTIFSSRENGMPEIVGRYGNQTGVMNNDQIVSSVSQGVAAAVRSVLGGGIGGGDIHIKIVGADGTVTGEQVITAAQRYNQRFGETVIQAG